MLARNLEKHDDYYFLVNYGATVYQGSKVNIDDDFSFSGFGPHDPKHRKAFTPGSYLKTWGRRYAIGSYKWYDQLYYHYYYPMQLVQRSIGIFDPNGNNAFAIPLTPKTFSGLSTRTYNKALEKLYDKIKSTDLNIALTIGERKESARMLKKAFEATASVLRMARKVRRQLLTKPSLLASNLWLQYKYGWLPLYNDVYAALNFHFELFSEMKFEGKSKIVEGWTETPWNNTLGPVPLVYKHGQQCQFIVYAGISDSDAYNATRITSLNPASIAWELVPFSFVVDWFVDVGGYLAMMEASLGVGLDFKRGMVTEVSYRTIEIPEYYQEYWWRWTYTSYHWRNNYSEISIDKGVNYRGEAAKTRTALSGFPRPRVPVFRVSLGSQRIISAAALIRQVLLKKV